MSEKKTKPESWQIGAAETYTAIGDTAKAVVRELAKNLVDDCSLVSLAVWYIGDAPNRSGQFEGMVTSE
jgi:hypothetical protein